MCLRIVTLAVARGQDKETVANESDQNGNADAAQHHAGLFLVTGIVIRFGLRLFSKARLNAWMYFRLVSWGRVC
jgi:hypothetical protein